MLFVRPANSWYSPTNAFRLTLQATAGNLVLQCIDDSRDGPAAVPLIGGAVAG
jgi:hypothetical protein